MQNPRRLIALVVTANVILWTTLWIDVAVRLVPYKPHAAAFEEQLPVVVFGGRALPIDQMHTTPVRIVESVQTLSFLAVRPLVHLMNRNPAIWDRIFWGMSAWSYLLILVMLLSFLQWYLVAQIVAWILPRLWRSG